MASKSQCSKSLLWKHSLYAKMRIWRMLEQLLLYSFFLSIKEDNFLPSFMTQSLARLIPFIFLVNWDLRTHLITLLDAVRGNSGTTATALTCTTFNNFVLLPWNNRNTRERDMYTAFSDISFEWSFVLPSKNLLLLFTKVPLRYQHAPRTTNRINLSLTCHK